MIPAVMTMSSWPNSFSVFMTIESAPRVWLLNRCYSCCPPATRICSTTVSAGLGPRSWPPTVGDPGVIHHHGCASRGEQGTCSRRVHLRHQLPMRLGHQISIRSYLTLDSVRATPLAETNRPPPRSICTHFKTKGYNPHVTADYVGVPNKTRHSPAQNTHPRKRSPTKKYAALS